MAYRLRTIFPESRFLSPIDAGGGFFGTLRGGRRFAVLDNPKTGAASAADGIRCDVDGNLWAGARPGVQVLTPGGERIGLIQLPEACANVCFGGPRRNRLFMTASQSLYAVYVNTTGAHIC